MSKSRNLAIAAGVFLAGGVAWWASHGTGPASPVAREAPPRPAASVSAEPPVPLEERVRQVMEKWRRAIVGFEAEGVLECDATFRASPAVFAPALRRSAEDDPDERVRAFSTKVIGKLRQPEDAAFLLGLLSDPSPLVRGNAAWALGQVPTPAHLAVLRRLAREDRAESVRRRANDLLAHQPTAAREASP